ncbi:hypothetical protein B0T19DRAFT_1658 [Cercophora scortea]|uniref:Dockerin type 1 n=1 Tax=Cercophora scortea TaxID=314031 RepID=A0AAE0J1E9_9PEZI|nr:hypothetical protein B0T19DRAFT_1658 [Cercophora scortea]
MVLEPPSVTVLGADPVHRRCVLNGAAFQQDAITSFNGWQYAVFYASLPPPAACEPLFIHVARRELLHGEWEVLILDDYPQTVDDGHNTVQLGICPGDGTIHLSYDHHCDILRYRHSIPNLAARPSEFKWTSALFTPTQSHLPGLPPTHAPFTYVTYPRFIPTSHNLLLTLRDGKAGLGNDHLYLYSPSTQHFSYIGAHLTGLQSNPYIHGLTYHHASHRLHTTWVYRDFVFYPGWDDPLDMKHKQQAGPNGAENNHDICYAYSDDEGYTWKNCARTTIADMRKGETIANDAEGITAFVIPKGSGLMNQEAQAVDRDGGVHVLNRDMLDGAHMWKHYYRSPDGVWTQRSLRPITQGSRRGRLATTNDGALYIILPDSISATMQILRATPADEYATYEQVWEGHGLTGEPLVDSARLEQENVLSLFACAAVEDGKRNVVVMDFRV